MDHLEEKRLLRQLNREIPVKRGKDSILMYLLVPAGYLLFVSALPARLSVALSGFLPGRVDSYYAGLFFVMGFVFVAFLYRRFGERVQIWENVSVRGILEAFVMGAALFVAVNFVMSPALANIFKTSGTNYSRSVEQLLAEPAAAFFQVTVAAPILEELVFRGFLLKRSLRCRGRWPSILLVSAVFGIFHLNIVQGICAMVAGIFLCLLYARRRSVFLCMLAHGFFNGFAFWLMIAFAAF